jgi:hypothetical protein
VTPGSLHRGEGLYASDQSRTFIRELTETGAADGLLMGWQCEKETNPSLDLGSALSRVSKILAGIVDA